MSVQFTLHIGRKFQFIALSCELKIDNEELIIVVFPSGMIEILVGARIARPHKHIVLQRRTTNGRPYG